MPFAVGRSGGGGTANAPRHVNEYGLIDDGRENFLRDCVWKAVHEIDDHGDTLTPQAVAARGWELFDAGAWNGDHKYSYERQCLAKARALLRRLNDGRVELGGKLTTNSEPTYIRAIDNNNNRDGLREALQAYADMLLQDFSSNTKEKRSS